MNVQTNIGREFLSGHIYLDTQRQHHQFYNELEYFSYHPGLQQQRQAVPLGPHRKTLLNWSQETVFIGQNQPFTLPKD